MLINFIGHKSLRVCTADPVLLQEAVDKIVLKLLPPEPDVADSLPDKIAVDVSADCIPLDYQSVADSLPEKIAVDDSPVCIPLNYQSIADSLPDDIVVDNIFSKYFRDFDNKLEVDGIFLRTFVVIKINQLVVGFIFTETGVLYLNYNNTSISRHHLTQYVNAIKVLLTKWYSNGKVQPTIFGPDYGFVDVPLLVNPESTLLHNHSDGHFILFHFYTHLDSLKNHLDPDKCAGFHKWVVHYTVDDVDVIKRYIVARIIFEAGIQWYVVLLLNNSFNYTYY